MKLQRRGFFKALAALPLLSKAKATETSISTRPAEAKIRLRDIRNHYNVIQRITEDQSFGFYSGVPYRLVDVETTDKVRIVMHKAYTRDGAGAVSVILYDSRYGLLPVAFPISYGDQLYLSRI